MKVDLFTFFLQDLIKLCVDKAERLFLQSVSILFCNHEIGILKVKILEFDSLFLYIFYFFFKTLLLFSFCDSETFLWEFKE